MRRRQCRDQPADLVFELLDAALQGPHRIFFEQRLQLIAEARLDPQPHGDGADEELVGRHSLGEMQWRPATMSWSPGSPPELVGEPQRCWFQRDSACSVLCASRLTPIVCKESSVTASCLS